jgi:hypothetical protein
MGVNNERNYNSAFCLFGSITATVHKSELILKQNVNEKEHHISQINIVYTSQKELFKNPASVLINTTFFIHINLILCKKY